VTPKEALAAGLQLNQDGRRRSAFELLGYRDVTPETVRSIWPETEEISDKTIRQLAIDAMYASYLDRQAADIAAFERDEALLLPKELNYAAVHGLSTELQTKLTDTQPRTLGQASRIDGMTPAALTALLGHVKRDARARA